MNVQNRERGEVLHLQMQVVFVDGDSVQGRKWDGGEYGFKIDSIIFTGEEVALMGSSHEENNYLQDGNGG